MTKGLQAPSHSGPTQLLLRHRSSSWSRRPAAVAAAAPAYSVRRATLEDAAAVSDIYAQTFGAGNFPGYEDNALIQQVEANYAAAVGRESSDKLADALAAKAQAATAARTYRLQRQAAMLKGQLAMARGLPASFPTEGPTELRQLAKWRRARRFVCLVVEEVEQQQTAAAADGGSSSSRSSSSLNGGSTDATSSSSSSSSSARRRLVGTATISMMQAEAVLPPPFPSGAPLRPYISNMAVRPEAQRRGIATALAGACGRIARAWGEQTVLLHVAADNSSAQQLYLACGFRPVANSSGLSGVIRGPWTQQRMAADTAVLAAKYYCRGGKQTAAGGGQSEVVSSRC